jgi:regulation of enolase protein 1 (concanavalin A-like superfamily)
MKSIMKWHSEPPQWSFEGTSIRVKTGKNTDFWRKTFYGFVRDNGHFLSQPATSDFTAEVSVSGKYEFLYDQAGLMLRVDERNWLKAGVEYTDGAMHFCVVITRDDYSDWSLVRLGDSARADFRIRLTRHAEALRVQYCESEKPWQLARLGHLPMPDEIQVGIMCCTPEREGFEVEFNNFTVGQAISRKLHVD